MATIDDLVAQIAVPEDERKKLLLNNVLFGLGTSLMGSRRGQEWTAASQGLQYGAQNAQSAITDARHSRLQGLQARGTAYDILNKESAYNDAELLRQQQRQIAQRFGRS